MNANEPVGERAIGAALVALSAASFGAMPIFARYAYTAGVDLYGILEPVSEPPAVAAGSIRAQSEAR